MDFKHILTGLLSKAYKQDEKGELFEALNNTEKEGALSADDLLNKILALDASRITSIKEGEKEAHKEHYSRGKRETMTELEKQLKEKYPSIKDSESKGIDLIEAIVLSNSKDKDITDTDIIKHSAYQQMESRLKAEKQTEIEKLTNELENFKKSVSKSKTMEAVESKLFSLRDSLGAVIPQSKDRALRSEQNLRRDLSEFDYEITDSGSILILKDGKILQDQHGNTKDFESFAKEHISGYYEFSSNAGGGNNPGGGEEGGTHSVGKVKTVEEFYSYLESDATAEEKEAFIKENAHIIDN